MLFPKKKALADEYLRKGYSPTKALHEVRIQENINTLPARPKALVEKHLAKGMSPSEAMEAGQQESQRLAQVNAQKITDSIKGRK